MLLAMLKRPIRASDAPERDAGRPQSWIAPGMWASRKETWKPHTKNAPVTTQ
jgi:hypothetical protein